jgi:putative transcriptional regulator
MAMTTKTGHFQPTGTVTDETGDGTVSRGRRQPLNAVRDETRDETINRGLEQAAEYFESGPHQQGRVSYVADVETVDVVRIRKKLGLSQREFSKRYGFPLATVRNWEQHRREPDRHAQMFLAVIDSHPELAASVCARHMGHEGDGA